MTKTDFAELKEKLCSFDSQKNYNEIVTETLIKNTNRNSKDPFVIMYSGARNAGRNESHTKSAAIISELIEIIKSQSECMNGYSHDYITLKMNACIAETTKRLQKLRDGK